ncbi:hypothetical protein HDR66_01785 [bacterium]|nr:hypothetical protein [bacterium]
MTHKTKFPYAGAIVLGMHDALVEISGIIAGLTFAITDQRIIIMTAVIAAISASMSMAAANYQANRADKNPHAGRCAIYTGIAYIATCVILIIPFAIIENRFIALGMMGMNAALVIFGFNCMVPDDDRPLLKRFAQMFSICAIVAITSFAIGIIAKHFLGVNI